ncbi:MAG: ANTAR domain-containing protein [Nakamurella sp.]
MVDADQIPEHLIAAIGGVRRGRPVADQLCASLVQSLNVDGAALTISAADGVVGSSMGASGPLSRELIDLEFMLGEGPSLQAVNSSAPVMAADLHGVAAASWFNFAGAASNLGVGAIFALPVAVAGLPMGALLLYRDRPGPLSGAALTGAYFAAELAALPILDVAGLDLDVAVEDDSSAAWEELTALTRSEVYQAAGVLIAQLGVSPTEALVRLRGYAFAHGRTTSEAAYDILEHRVRLADDGTGRRTAVEEDS